MKALALTVIAAVILSGCAVTPLSKEARNVAVSTSKMVGNCTYLGLATGLTSNIYGSDGPLSAKNDALERAVKMGATNVVWRKVESGGLKPNTATADAYRCPATLAHK